MMWRFLCLGGVILSLFSLSGCSEPESTVAKAPVIRPALVEVVSATLASELTFNGVVRASKRADLSFRFNGRLTSIEVNEGDKVTQGQLLATLDSRDATTALETAKLEFDNINKEYQRAKSIYDRTQAIARSEVDKLATQLNVAKNRVEEATRQQEYTKIYAPFDGTISEKLVENFAQVQANQIILTLQDLSNLEIVIEVPNRIMLSGVRNDTAYAEFSAIPNQRFDLLLRTYSALASSESQTYSVVLGFTDIRGYRILPGMSAKVTPTDPVNRDGQRVVTLPLTAIVPNNQGGQFIWVVGEDNIATQRAVELGSTLGNRVVIQQNLEPGDRVIIAGVSSVQPGMIVRPYTADQSGE